MATKDHELEFEAVIAKLLAWREQIIDELRASETHDDALQIKRQLDAAITCLEFCQRHQIRLNSEVMVLLNTQTRTPASNYRVLEDHETEIRECWVELEVNGKPLHLYPGDIIIS